MSRQPADPDPDAVERSIRRTLERLGRDVTRAVEAGLFDDGAVAGLDGHVRDLEALLEEADRAVRRLARPEPLAVARIAAAVFEDLLADIEKPLLLSIDWGDALPLPATPHAAVERALRRLFDVVLRSAEPGDRIAVRALAGSDPAVVRIDVALAVADAGRADRTIDALGAALVALTEPSAGIVLAAPRRAGGEVRLVLEIGDAACVER